MASPFLSIAAGYLRGQRGREQQDYERSQAEQARADRIAQQQQQMQMQADERKYQRERDAAVDARQRAMDDRQTQGDLRNAYESGYDPLPQVQAQGQRLTDTWTPQTPSDMDGSGIGSALQMAGQTLRGAKPVYSVGGTPLAKTRMSAAEQAREDQQQQARDLRASQERIQLQIATEALQGRRDMQTQAQQDRKEIQGMIQAGRRQPSPRASLPTEGERKASAFYISGKQGYDTMEALLANDPATGKPRAVPSWTGRQMAKVGMGAGNVLTNDQTRQLRQAANQMADAWLRYTSGAAVPEQEVERFGQSFIPEPGDDPVTLKQKADARRTIMEALRSAGGRALPSAPTSPGDLVRR